MPLPFFSPPDTISTLANPRQVIPKDIPYGKDSDTVVLRKNLFHLCFGGLQYIFQMIHCHFIFCRQRYEINSEHSYIEHGEMCQREFSDAGKQIAFHNSISRFIVRA